MRLVWVRRWSVGYSLPADVGRVGGNDKAQAFVRDVGNYLLGEPGDQLAHLVDDHLQTVWVGDEEHPDDE